MFRVVRFLLIAAVVALLSFPAQSDARDGARDRQAPVTHNTDQQRNPKRPFQPNVDNRNQGGKDVWQLGRRQGDRDHDRARSGVMGGRLLPLEVVLANVSRSIPGHHIGVDGPFNQGGRWVYRIKWLTPDGRVIIVFADAYTGVILGTRGGR